MIKSKGYYDTQLFNYSKYALTWKALCNSYFQKLISKDSCVLELGAGYGHFINNIHCKRKIAIDIWEGMLDHLSPEVEGHIGNAANLSCIPDDAIDFVFASNFFEHLTQQDFSEILEQLHNKLKPGGTLNIIQPNFRYAFREYFDDYTHVSIYSDRSIMDFLASHNFSIVECIPRFLPLTLKSRFPVLPILISIYLALPFKPFGKQMLVRAKVIK